ncbi:MAG: glycosyl hydrolase, partial [Planctomycetota bacterium]
MCNPKNAFAIRVTAQAGLLLGTVFLAGTVIAQTPQELVQGFSHPPDAAKPRVYWWWLNSLVNKEGITRDLEEYKAKGIGGVLLFDAGCAAGPMPEGLEFMSPPWREMVKHALREADRLGIEVSINLCSGWDAGGSWIAPAYACKQVVHSELTVKGPQRLSRKLPDPPGNKAYYRDIVVQALPALPGKGPGLSQVTASSCQHQGVYAASNVADSNEKTFWVSKGVKPGEDPTKEKPEWVRFEWFQPITTKNLWMVPRVPYGPRQLEVQVSEDGKIFKTVKSFSIENNAPVKLTFPETASKIFRILITASYAAENTQICEVSFTGRIADDGRAAMWAQKSARNSPRKTIRQNVEAPLAEWEPSSDDAPIPISQVINLTPKMQPGGLLEWDVPQGDWTVLRIGYTITGNEVQCSSPGGGGLEVDWLNAEAMTHHFRSMAEILLADAGPLVGKSLKYFHDDSWEVGIPNWTDGFLDEFVKYRGYDARGYLPVLAGRIVGDANVSDRFLYDYRKTIADCLTVNHYRRFAELSHARGLGIHPESGGPCYPTIVPMDALRNLGCGDIPMGEFWHSYHWHEGSQNTVGKQTATAAHIYGKQYAAAEAFTSMGPHWEEGPHDLKPTADIAFCEGINRFVIHTSTCTRPQDPKPGFEYFAGTHFNPNVTWWDKSGAWLAYLGRCQFLLSQGLFVGDVCYYYGDWAPNLVEPKHTDPSLGPGYDYDVCNAEVLLERMSVKDGRIVLPDGMSYRILVLPQRRRMPVEILQKIKELVAIGATIVGPKPQMDPGLKDYPQCDRTVRTLAQELWGACDGQGVRERAFGRGRIFWGKPLREILAGDGVKPDFEYTGGQKDALLDFIHRTTGQAEIYFVANRNDRWEPVITCTFRVAGKQPEIWDPVTGRKWAATDWHIRSGRTVVPLQFAPYQS